MPYDDTCADAWMEYKAGQGAGEKRSTGSGKWNQHVKNGDGWQLQIEKMTSGSKGKASGKGKLQGTGETETRLCYDGQRE